MTKTTNRKSLVSVIVVALLCVCFGAITALPTSAEELTTAVSQSYEKNSTEGDYASTGAAEFMYGDANGDGKIDATDVVLLRKYIANYNYDTGSSTVVLGPKDNPTAHAHVWVTDVAVPASCTQTGLTEGKHCSACNEVLVAQEEIAAIGHNYDMTNLVWVWNGYESATVTMYCTQNNSHTKQLNANITDKTTENATCTKVGVKIYTATVTVDGVAYTSTKEATLAPLGHKEVIDASIAATCEQAGLTAGSHCSVCEKVLIPQTEIPKSGHVEVIDKGYESSCRENGLSDGKHCSACDFVIEAQVKLPLKSHAVVIDAVVAPTCTTSGLSQGSHCSECGIIIEEQKVLVSSHDYDTIHYVYNPDSTISEIILPCKKCDEYETVTGLYAEYVGNDAYIGTSVSVNDIKAYFIVNYFEKIPTVDFSVDSLEIEKIGPNYINVKCHDFDTTVIINGYIEETAADDFTYTVSNEKVTITAYMGTEAAVRIPDEIEGYPVVAIAKAAFKDNLYIKSVMFSDNIQSVAANAFSGCTLLETIVLNEGLLSIGYNAFANTAITELIIPNTVTTISNNSSTKANYSIVAGCQKLRRVVLGNGLTKVTEYLFKGLESLGEVVIGENVTTIGIYAFDGCKSLQNITIPDRVTLISYNAFSNCTSLQNITWGNSLAEIGSSSFKGCTSLTSVRLPDSVKTIYHNAFNGCTLLEAIVLNEGLITIQYNAFANTAITELIIPNSVTSITDGSDYFDKNTSIVEGCQKLRIVVLGNGLTTVTEYLFQNLVALEEVVIGENVTTIGSYAFNGCTSLQNITIPDSVITINSYAFAASGLRSIKIPNKVNTIGDYAFSSCAKLEYLLIDGTALKKIGKNVTSSSSTRRIYYKGSITDWNAISINTTNAAPFNQIPYIYSEDQPTEKGNYWHYAGNGEPIVWDISLSEYKVYALCNAYTGTMGSSLLSCSTNYINVMEDDAGFMAHKSLYEAATLVSDPGSALENQMSKEQLYIIVLLDAMGYNHAGKSEIAELETNILKFGTFASSYIDGADKIFDFSAMKDSFNAMGVVGDRLDTINKLVATAKDQVIASQYLLGFALQCQSSIDILMNIVNDKNNDKDLRNAANKVVDIITTAFEGTLQELIDKDMGDQYARILGSVAINSIWDVACDFYLPLKIAGLIAEGVVITLDFFCDTGVSVDAYYKLKVTAAIENSLRRQINSLNGDYLRRENINESSLLYGVINLYNSVITKGYKYTLNYLNSVDKNSEYIQASYLHNTTAFKQFELEVENTYYSLYSY